jgi:hypothetical protein
MVTNFWFRWTVFPETLTGFQLGEEFPTFYETQMFITAFTCAPFWARKTQCMPPHAKSWRSLLILFSHVCVGIVLEEAVDLSLTDYWWWWWWWWWWWCMPGSSKWSFPSGIPTKFCTHLFCFSRCYMSCLSHSDCSNLNMTTKHYCI